MSPGAWWSNAVFYQVYPRSFADSNGDGVGDIDGLVAHLDHLERLGVDAIWLSPVTVSPMADHGYDVADPRDIDPLFGGMPAIERLIAAAHQRGIKITMDVVPNHTSSQHVWFQAALAAGPGTDARERYFFRDGRGPDGALPPNNWTSVFGGSAWTRVVEPDGNPGQYYLHLFDTEQPDLNWENPEVFDDFEKTLRFWLERGVDGFRIDVAHGMAKPPGLPDTKEVVKVLSHTDDDPRFNNPSVHEIHRGIRKIVDDYPDAVTIGEVWVMDNRLWAEYLRPDELHLGFNFRLTKIDFDAGEIHDAIQNSLDGHGDRKCRSDLDTVQSRRGPRGYPLRRRRDRAAPGAGHGAGDARAARHGVHLQRRGTRAARRVGPARRGAAGPDLGTLRTYRTWPRQVPGSAPLVGRHSPVRVLDVRRHLVADASGVGDADRAKSRAPIPTSTLSFFQRAIELRKSRDRLDDGSEVDGFEWLPAPSGALAFRGRGGLVCAVNTGDRPIALPDGELILASAPLVAGRLAPDAAAWLV